YRSWPGPARIPDARLLGATAHPGVIRPRTGPEHPHAVDALAVHDVDGHRALERRCDRQVIEAQVEAVERRRSAEGPEGALEVAIGAPAPDPTRQAHAVSGIPRDRAIELERVLDSHGDPGSGAERVAQRFREERSPERDSPV